MNTLLYKTSLHNMMPLQQGGFMHAPKRDYWTERGFSSRKEWLEWRTQQYRLKTSKPSWKNLEGGPWGDIAHYV